MPQTDRPEGPRPYRRRVTKTRREVVLDWARARPDRIPIRWEERATPDFGERAFGRRGGTEVHGMVGWDPALGWVLVLDEPTLGSPSPEPGA